jgi:hypothetical protein
VDPVTELPTHLALVGVVLLGLGAAHLVLPLVLAWRVELAGMSSLNREVSYVHCYFIGLMCLLWGLLPLTAGAHLLDRDPIARLVLVGAVVFWASRLVIQFVVFNHHARDSRPWCALSVAGTGLWLYVTAVWGWALAGQV